MITNKYQVTNKGFGTAIVFAIVIIFCLIYGEPPIGFSIMVGISAAIALTVHLRWEYTYSVEINTADKLIIVVSKSRTNRVRDEIPLDEVYFTYKKRHDYYGSGFEMIGRQQQARSILQTECKQKTLAFLVPGQEGWSENMIMNLAKDLATAGVKQVVEKHNEAEIPITTSSP
ncbi:hypothetical protein IDJ77_20120 [Mucilaginibacter sp. ZT4R22]|uniref:Uncharacterized protein n=1 Tax=Mucilaginibacter pankratovii TaxID=2772110 RepID=A0ABR7WV01_9SPHI|nr:hypothetical protein [Mucilaginibacter pankratovii]MBD1366128.1 hypothetical protein [Mucilaginibacter pankratovii]